jgi:hypothetical protein
MKYIPLDCLSFGPDWKKSSIVLLDIFRDRNWEVQAGSPDKMFDKKCLYV